VLAGSSELGLGRLEAVEDDLDVELVGLLELWRQVHVGANSLRLEVAPLAVHLGNLALSLPRAPRAIRSAMSLSIRCCFF
jgi:hypothetical protein